MQLIDNIQDWQNLRANLDPKLSLGFVPTMGNLHSGHGSLIHTAKSTNDLTVVSILVNPTQFNEQQDFDLYPRTLDADLKLLSDLEVDYCFLPSHEEMYPDNYRFRLSETELSLLMEGVYRPGHFTGMLTIVMKLLILVRPTDAYFGEKDYQQYSLIHGMVKAFFMNIKIHCCPTIREKSKLALSSRNGRLNADELKLAENFASIFHQSKTCEEILAKLEQVGIKVEYILDRHNRRFAAVKIGDVRLIDNYSLSF